MNKTIKKLSKPAERLGTEATEIKDYLKRYESEKRRADSLKEEYLQLVQLYKELTTNAPRGWRPAEQEKLNRVATSINKLPERERAARKKCNEVKRIIDAVPGNEGDLLRKRYIECLTWDEIAARLCYSLTGVHTVHRRALLLARDLMKAQGVNL